MAKKKNDKNKLKKNNTKANNLRSELKKVSWPSATELSKATTAVLFIVIFTALIIFLSDTIFSLGSKKFTNYVNSKNPNNVQTTEVDENGEAKIDITEENQENNVEDQPTEEENAEKTEETEAEGEVQPEVEAQEENVEANNEN